MPMATEMLSELREASEKLRRRPVPRPPPVGARQLLNEWMRGHALNVTRHAAALRPFYRGEFGNDAAAPTEGHVRAVNALIDRLRQGLLKLTGRVTRAARKAAVDPSTENLDRIMGLKDTAHNWVRAIEKIWDFYFELFGQRQSKYADWLLGCDRIALDCYQDAYMGLGKARSIPAPSPYSYMRTGFSPATYRRGIRLRSLGLQLNPFPLVQLPFHRLVNPWTLGAVLHEVSHNLQSDLGLSKVVSQNIARRLTQAGMPPLVASTWSRWNREIFADMSGLLLGGPPIVGSLMDVIGRAPAVTATFVPGAPHPTPYLRAFLSFELLERMGFSEEAARYRSVWTRTYPNPGAGNIPPEILRTRDDAVAIVVDAICYHPFEPLGQKKFAEVIRFQPKELLVMEEAARRLAAGNDPGVVPERFLIGAARIAMDRRLARPGVITENFFKELARR